MLFKQSNCAWVFAKQKGTKHSLIKGASSTYLIQKNNDKVRAKFSPEIIGRATTHSPLRKVYESRSVQFVQGSTDLQLQFKLECGT